MATLAALAVTPGAGWTVYTGTDGVLGLTQNKSRSLMFYAEATSEPAETFVGHALEPGNAVNKQSATATVYVRIKGGSPGAAVFSPVDA